MSFAELKERAYRANGVEAVFLYPEDLQGRDWQERVMGKIGEASGYRYRPTR